MHIIDAVMILRPGTYWNLRGDVLEQAEDGTPRVTIPTWEEINAVLEANSYVELRRSEYPTVGDQLDAIWKGGQAADEMRTKILAVKAKFPKGE